eukprot:SAG22_NODE_2784_length_2212_cov_2.925225_5_plen_55_part_00
MPMNPPTILQRSRNGRANGGQGAPVFGDKEKIKDGALSVRDCILGQQLPLCLAC